MMEAISSEDRLFQALADRLTHLRGFQELEHGEFGESIRLTFQRHKSTLDGDVQSILSKLIWKVNAQGWVVSENESGRFVIEFEPTQVFQLFKSRRVALHGLERIADRYAMQGKHNQARICYQHLNEALGTYVGEGHLELKLAWCYMLTGQYTAKNMQRLLDDVEQKCPCAATAGAGNLIGSMMKGLSFTDSEPTEPEQRALLLQKTTVMLLRDRDVGQTWEIMVYTSLRDEYSIKDTNFQVPGYLEARIVKEAVLRLAKLAANKKINGVEPYGDDLAFVESIAFFVSTIMPEGGPKVDHIDLLLWGLRVLGCDIAYERILGGLLDDFDFDFDIEQLDGAHKPFQQVSLHVGDDANAIFAEVLEGFDFTQKVDQRQGGQPSKAALVCAPVLSATDSRMLDVELDRVLVG